MSVLCVLLLLVGAHGAFGIDGEIKGRGGVAINADRHGVRIAIGGGLDAADAGGDAKVTDERL